MKNGRRSFSAQQKASIIREPPLEGKSVSAVYESHGIAPSLFYLWQKRLFEGAERAFERDRSERGTDKKGQERMAYLEARLARKEQVIAEVTADYVQQKKRAWGELKSEWVGHDVREAVVDFVREFSGKTELPEGRIVCKS